MINLLYIILIAMLAINISSDVLDGFHTASKDMQRNVEGLKTYNSVLSKAAADRGMAEQAQLLEGQANESSPLPGGIDPSLVQKLMPLLSQLNRPEKGNQGRDQTEQPDRKGHGCR